MLVWTFTQGRTGLVHTLARAGCLLDPCAGPHKTALRHWMGWSIFCPMGLSNCFFPPKNDNYRANNGGVTENMIRCGGLKDKNGPVCQSIPVFTTTYAQ